MVTDTTVDCGGPLESEHLHRHVHREYSLLKDKKITISCKYYDFGLNSYRKMNIKIFPLYMH